MGSIDRWLGYAKAKVESALRSGNRELDELEAEREAATADQPWLRSQGPAPTFEEAKARIEYQARQAAEHCEPKPGQDPPQPPTDGETSPPVTSPQDQAQDAEAASAKVELEARQREASARLDAIREELGVDRPVDSGPSTPST